MGANIKAAPTLAPRAPLEVVRSCWASEIVEAGGKKEGNLVPEGSRRGKRTAV